MEQTETDLTAVIIPAGQLTVEEVHQIVLDSGRHAALVRVAPLPKLNLVQIEVHDPRRGLPTEDPALVGRFSKGGRSTFVHVNHSAKQAMVHGFIDGRANEGFAGSPGDEFLERLRVEAGVELAALTGADDGTRIGIGVAASHTVALIRGRTLALPVGTPTGLDGFTFHDRGNAVDEGAERLAWFAFDRARAFAQPGKAMAALIGSAPPGALGPLEGARAEAIAALDALGDRTPAEAKLASARALELCAYAAAVAWTGGDQVSYWDGRVLPMFAIAGRETPLPAVLDPSEAEELDDETESLLEAMVETLPFGAPPDGEGPMLTQLSAAEVQPLAPWAQAGEEHAGCVFTLRPERLLSLTRGLDGQRLGNAAEMFARAWYRALRPGQPEGDAYQQWRLAKEQEGEKDLERFVNDWAELRACLEIATANRLDVALLFYA